MKPLNDSDIANINNLCAASNVNSDVAVYIEKINEGTYSIDVLVDDYSLGTKYPRKRKITLTASNLQRND